jgi:hypothetical protein
MGRLGQRIGEPKPYERLASHAQSPRFTVEGIHLLEFEYAASQARPDPNDEFQVKLRIRWLSVATISSGMAHPRSSAHYAGSGF